MTGSAPAVDGDSVSEFADAGLAAYICEVRANPGRPPRDIGAAGLRDAAEQRAANRSPGPQLHEVREVSVPGRRAVRSRLYRPAPGGRPLVVYFHGGGWVFGDLSSHDRACRRLASAADVDVLAVDYRRAPESPWPAAVDDALDVVRWVRDGSGPVATPSRLGLAGDSAGGSIAALTCLCLRDAGEPQPDLQVLAYADLDLTLTQPSVETKGSGFGFDSDDARWFAAQWVPDASRRADPRVSPVHEPDLAGLAPALVVTAEHDLTRDEGNAYAAALLAADVPVVHRCERGQVHGFVNLDETSEAARDAGDRLWGDVGRLLHGNA